MTPNLASVFTEIGDWLEWAPEWLQGTIMIAIAVIAAVAIHGVAFSAIRRAIGNKRDFLRILVDRMRGPARLALILFMVGTVLPVVPLDRGVAAGLQHFVLIAVVLLIGWAALAAIQISADLYLRRFQADAADSLVARKHTTQIRILERAAVTLVVIFTIAGILMTFEPVRQYGLSLFASAGVAGIVAGIAARPVLSNLFAGLQIAVAQPIRIGDIVVVENEWGRVEEITGTYVVIRAWDLRRLIVPLGYFIEKPFQNWTRETTQLLAPVVLHLDYRAPIDAIRKKVDEIAEDSPYWDRGTKTVQMIDSTPDGIQVRVLLSARDSSDQWNLRCEVREKLVAFLQLQHPEALPRQRTAVEGAKTMIPEADAISARE